MLFGVPYASLAVILGLAAFGFVTHVILKVAELRDADSSVTLTSYFSVNPYRTIGKGLTVVGAVIGLAQPEITPLVAVGCYAMGYAADSAGNRLGK